MVGIGSGQNAAATNCDGRCRNHGTAAAQARPSRNSRPAALRPTLCRRIDGGSDLRSFARPRLTPASAAATPAPEARFRVSAMSERAFFEVAKEVFQEVDAVPDGLGPRFNLDSCGLPFTARHRRHQPGNQSAGRVGHRAGAKNVVPSFITANGPVREARFVRNPDGTPDGGVHGSVRDHRSLGRAGLQYRAAGLRRASSPATTSCSAFRRRPSASAWWRTSRMPALEAALAANAQQKRALGISGRFNPSGNDGTITRFGWKAQNKSLLLFSGEAYNVEIGVTNDLFPNERETIRPANSTSHPESPTPLMPDGKEREPVRGLPVDIALFAAFMRLLAPPARQRRPDGASAGGPGVLHRRRWSRRQRQCLAVGRGLDRLGDIDVVDIVDRARRPADARSSRTSDVRPVTSGLTTEKATVAALSNVTFEP